MKKFASHYLIFCAGMSIGLGIGRSPDPMITALVVVGFMLFCVGVISYLELTKDDK